MKTIFKVIQIMAFCALGACADTTEITDITPYPEIVNDGRPENEQVQMTYQRKMEKLKEIFPSQFHVFGKSCGDVKETVAGHEIQSFQIPFAAFWKDQEKAWGQMRSLRYEIYLDKNVGIRFVKFRTEYNHPPGNEHVNGGGGFYLNPKWTFEGNKLVVEYGDVMGFYLFTENGKTYLHSKIFKESVEVTPTEIKSSLVELPFCG